MARARQMPSDGQTPWDQRLCDGLLDMIRSSSSSAGGGGGGTGGGVGASPFFVVAHVPLASLVDDVRRAALRSPASSTTSG